MSEKKTLDELTLMDDYMFAAVMQNTKFLRPLLEFVLQVKITGIELTEPQKNEKKGYTSKGVRLDLYVIDDKGNIYNVEVQTTNERNLPKRMCYYQSIIDISILNPGDLYNELRKSFVIFICNYDPFDRERYIYTFENICREEPDITFGDGTTKVVINTRGSKGKISAELEEIIKYLRDEEVTGEFSRELDNAVNAVKASEERRREYMMLNMRDNEIRAEARAEGRAEGRKDGENRMGTLIKMLLTQGRIEDVGKASEDPEYRDQLYREFQIA